MLLNVIISGTVGSLKISSRFVPVFHGRFSSPCFQRLSGPVRILKHSNKILISCLHPDHPIRDQEIESVSYKVSEKVDHSKNKVSGKRKRGGQVKLDASKKIKIYRIVFFSFYKKHRQSWQSK